MIRPNCRRASLNSSAAKTRSPSPIEQHSRGIPEKKALINVMSTYNGVLMSYHVGVTGWDNLIVLPFMLERSYFKWCQNAVHKG